MLARECKRRVRCASRSSWSLETGGCQFLAPNCRWRRSRCRLLCSITLPRTRVCLLPSPLYPPSPSDASTCSTPSSRFWRRRYSRSRWDKSTIPVPVRPAGRLVTSDRDQAIRSSQQTTDLTCPIFLVGGVVRGHASEDAAESLSEHRTGSAWFMNQSTTFHSVPSFKVTTAACFCPGA